MAPEPHISSYPVDLYPVDLTEADELADLRVAAMRDSLERVGRFDPVRARDRFLLTFCPEHTRHIVQSGARVGFMVLKTVGDEFLLDHLYIRPGHQGQGIGAAVLALVFSQADALGLPVRVGALKGSEANRFYVRHGFVGVEHGEFDNYYVRPHTKMRG